MRWLIIFIVLMFSFPATADEQEYATNWIVTCTNDKGEIIFKKPSYNSPGFGYNTNQKYIQGRSVVDGSQWTYYPIGDIYAACIIQSVEDYKNDNE